MQKRVASLHLFVDVPQKGCHGVLGMASAKAEGEVEKRIRGDPKTDYSFITTD